MLCDALNSALDTMQDVEVDRDTSQPEPGMPLPDRIKEMISSCDLFIVLLTESGLSSPWVTTEVAWATSIGKRVIPVLQEGRTLSEVPSLRGDLEYINYDPANYEYTIDMLRRFVENALKIRRGRESLGNATLGKEAMIMDRLDLDDIDNLLLLKTADLAPALEERLRQNAKSTITDFFADPRYATLTNIATLATDASVIIIRKETLHALLRAAQKGNSSIFRREGYEAGTLYGIGVIKWFLEKSSTVRGRKGLPRDPIGLLRACAKIDEASGWGKIEMTATRSDRIAPVLGGWTGTVSIKSNFLAHEFTDARMEDSSDRYTTYKAFWKGYLEGTFSAALGAWYGTWVSAGEENVPFFAAQCEERDDVQTSDLVFNLRVQPPTYNMTYMTLQRELLCPYLRGENARVVRSARGVLEGFVRELAGSASSEEDVRGITRALAWLGQHVDNAAKGSAAYLQETRTFLHEHVHDVSTEPSDGVTRRILRSTASAVFMACRDIRLDDKMKLELQAILSRRNTE